MIQAGTVLGGGLHEKPHLTGGILAISNSLKAGRLSPFLNRYITEYISDLPDDADITYKWQYRYLPNDTEWKDWNPPSDSPVDDSLLVGIQTRCLITSNGKTRISSVISWGMH